MQFKYGTFSHTVDGVNLLSHQKRKKFGNRGARYSQESTLHIRVDLRADTHAALRALISALETGYLRDGSAAGLYEDDGTATQHVLPSSNSVNGVQIVKLDYLKDDGAENNIQRTVDIILQAEYLQIEDEFLEFQEIVHQVGNAGPAYEVEQTFFGPIAILTALSTPKVLVQTGFTEAVSAWPVYPGPLYPANEQQHRRQVSFYGPKRGIVSPIGYGVRWTYYMIMDFNALALPRSRPT